MTGTRICIENDRLLIRSLEEQDLEGLSEIRNDPLVYRYEPVFLSELQGAADEALETIQQMDLFRDRQCILGVFEKSDPGTLAGLAEFYDYKPSGNVISLGYRFLSEYWGRGIATSCIQAMIDYIKNNTEVKLITAHVLPENKASSRCLIKNSFEHLLTKTEDWGYGYPSIVYVYTLDCLIISHQKFSQIFI